MEGLVGLVDRKAQEKVQTWITGNAKDDLEKAIISGTGIDDVIKSMTQKGATKEQAASKVKSIVKEYFEDGTLDKNTAEKYLKAYAGMDADQARENVQTWITDSAKDDLELAIANSKGIDAVISGMMKDGASKD